jgi:hypothetical protein
VYGTFIHSILYTQDFLACWQNSHHNIEKKKEVGPYNLIDFCKFFTKEDFSFRFYTYNAKINDIIANVMVSP